MPELPEVETFVRSLRAPLMDRAIRGIWNDWPGHIVTPTLVEFEKRVIGRRFQGAGRRGKYLIFTLDKDESLIIHLKMTGHLSVVPKSTPADKYVHTTFLLDDGNELRFRDIRKFGRVYLVNDPDDILGGLGPEPLSPEFTIDQFQALLIKRKRVIKPLLLDQTFIAGIGNIYADEALHRSQILPTRHSNSLVEGERKNLFVSIQKVLQEAIDFEGASVDNYRKPDGTKGDMQLQLLVYGREGELCPRCNGVIQRMVLGGRGTHYCPDCQF